MPCPPQRRRDLIVIGGGAGGLVVASVASRLGLAVTLIEKRNRLGGDCLHYGCIPSKTLIHSANLAWSMRRADRAGLGAVEPKVDMAAVNRRIREVIDHIQQHDDPQRFRDYGCEVLFGHARFVDTHTVEVDGCRLPGRRFVIATGSQPFIPDIEGLEQAGYLTNRELFSLPHLPPRLIVLGGGPVGVEMAQAFHRLGSRVTLIEQAPQLLLQHDRDIADTLQQRLRAEGMDINTASRAVKISRDNGVHTVHCDNGKSFEAEQLLVAVGRRPDVASLGLEVAGVETGAQGIVVDRRMRSSQKHIYACGDVCGPYALTHMAEYQAGIIISNAVFRLPKQADYRVVVQAVYTTPEVAQVGLTETQARQQGIEVKVLRFDFDDIDRTLAEDESSGFCKLITRKGKILGAGIVGSQAGELIHELALAMQTGAGLSELSATIHAYPTRSQIHRRTANTAYAPKLFSRHSRSLVKWINRLLP